jgi:hypothetical protein
VLAAVAIDAWWRRRERDHTTEAAPDVSDASTAPVPTGADA